MIRAKPFSIKRSKKPDREFKVLFGLIELYLESGKPIGSNTLRENGFEELSSATIRNYFAHLEESGYLTQQHASGGRLPTSRAFRFYAETYAAGKAETDHVEDIRLDFPPETKEPVAFLFRAAEALSTLSGTAVCLAAPRFDHDFILDVKLVGIDAGRCACVLVTDFGLVRTEVLPTPARLSNFALKRIEQYIHWHLRGGERPETLSHEEEQAARRFYEEIMIRFIVGYGNFSHSDFFRTGFAKLLNYSEFNDPVVLANSLSLFENSVKMRQLLTECQTRGQLAFWIGEDFAPYGLELSGCSFLAIPYRIRQSAVGAIGLLGPMRIPYRKLFHLLQQFANGIGETLTRSLYKYKLQYRQPSSASQAGGQEGVLAESSLKLLEIKNQSGARHD